MAENLENLNEVEQKLTGLWHNHRSDYLWDFRPDVDGEKRVVIMDERKPTPGSWMPFYFVTTDQGQNSYLNLSFTNTGSKHKITFISDNIIEVLNPPVDHSAEGGRESITLHKV